MARQMPARCVLRGVSRDSPPPTDGDPVAAVAAMLLRIDRIAPPPASDRTAIASMSSTPIRSVPSAAIADCAAVAIARSAVAFQKTAVQILI